MSNSAGVPMATGPSAHCAVMNGCPRSAAGTPLSQCDQESGAEQRQRFDQQRAARTLDAVGDARRARRPPPPPAHRRSRRPVRCGRAAAGRRQTAGAAASAGGRPCGRSVTSAAAPVPDADRPARRRASRSSARTPIAAVASTVISPIVSKPRKSTRMTLTMLRPWPSVGPNRQKYSRSRGAVSVVETEQHTARRSACRCRPRCRHRDSGRAAATARRDS